jgi:predicted phosphoribosyltransferase
MSRPQYKNAPRVFVIVDNGSDHRGQAAISRLARAHPNAIMIHTPVHASWLNQAVRHEVAVRREAVRTEGGGRPPRRVVAAAWWELSAV